MLTANEKNIILRIFKYIDIEYNANSISKHIGMTRMGALKALKGLEKEGIVTGKQMGRARFYKLNLLNEYTSKTVELLLMEESKKKLGWKEEFKELFKISKVVIIFGSILRNEEKAHDIDLLIIIDKKNNLKLNEIINEKNQLLTKRIHPLKQTEKDFKQNLNKKNKVIINSIKEGIVLQGYEKYIRLIKDATY